MAQKRVIPREIPKGGDSRDKNFFCDVLFIFKQFVKQFVREPKGGCEKYEVRGSIAEHVTESEALVFATIERPTSSENNLRQFDDVVAKRVHRFWLTRRRVSADELHISLLCLSSCDVPVVNASHGHFNGCLLVSQELLKNFSI